MRTRTIEIPLCDRCKRDGIPLRVEPIGGGEVFTIVRCPEVHIPALQKEAGREGEFVEVMSEGEQAPRPRGRQHRLPGTGERAPANVRRDQVLRAVKEHPEGISVRDIAIEIGSTRGAVSAAARRLYDEGLVRAEGKTTGRKLFPA